MRHSRQIALLVTLASSVLLAAGSAFAQPAAADVIAVGKLERPATKTPGSSPCVLRVSSVDRKPASVGLKAGDTMTLVGDRARDCAGAGEVRVTGSVVSLGDHVTLQGMEIQPLPVPALTAVPLVMAGGPSVATMSQRLKAAELVVQGKVMEIRDPPVIAAGGRHPISEHDPKWKDAVVQVLEKVKGDVPQTVVVRFPSSRDIAFRDVPKFHLGQTATLLLSKGNFGGPLVEAPGEKVYVAPSPADVLPPAATQRLKQMMDNR